MISRVCAFILLLVALNARAATVELLSGQLPGYEGVTVKVSTDCQLVFQADIEIPPNIQASPDRPQVVEQATAWALDNARPKCPLVRGIWVYATTGSRTVFKGSAFSNQNWKLHGTFFAVYQNIVPSVIPIDPRAVAAGVPPSYQLPFSLAFAGLPFEATRNNASFISGVAAVIQKECAAQLPVLPVVSEYVVAGHTISAMGDYATNAVDSVKRQTQETTVYLTGASVGKNMACSRDAVNFLLGLNKSVSANMHDAQGGPSKFMRTCTMAKVLTEEQCFCFAKVARGYEPNIFQMAATPAVMDEVVNNSNLLAKGSIIGICHINRYR
ncbi:hypothetical protein [Paraburkholderia dipogonis]|uniref:hypothetical protein n=1 Tax=Paraburkholderia dipogonis TaxID=1211383 RepID=UPI0038BBCE84